MDISIMVGGQETELGVKVSWWGWGGEKREQSGQSSLITALANGFPIQLGK